MLFYHSLSADIEGRRLGELVHVKHVDPGAPQYSQVRRVYYWHFTHLVVPSGASIDGLANPDRLVGYARSESSHVV